MHRTIYRSFAICCVAILAACSSSGSSPTGAPKTSTTLAKHGGDPANAALPPVIIGVISQTSGAGGFPDGPAALATAVSYVNADRGGIDGHRLQVKLCESTDNPESNQECAQKFANDDAVQLVVYAGSQFGDAIHATIASSGKAEFGVAPLTAADLLTNKMVTYSGGVLGVIQTAAIHGIETYGKKNVALLVSDEATAKTGAGFVTALFDAAGVKYTRVDLASKDPDIIGAVTAANLGDKSWVMAVVLSRGCVQLADAMDTLSLKTPVVTSVLCASKAVVDATGLSKLDGWWMIQPFRALEDPKLGNADVVEFNRVLKVYGNDKVATGGATGGIVSAFVSLQTVGDKIGFAQLSVASWKTGLKAFTGPVFLGPNKVACTATPPFMSVCTLASIAYKLHDGVFTPSRDGFIDPKVWLATHH